MARETTLRDLDTAQLLCMRGAFGHEWEPIARPKRAGEWGFRIHARCGRCGTERTSIFDTYGNQAAHYYERPRTWLTLTEPHTTGDVRLEMVRRLRRAQIKKVA